MKYELEHSREHAITSERDRETVNGSPQLTHVLVMAFDLRCSWRQEVEQNRRTDFLAGASNDFPQLGQRARLAPDHP
jgi:hypothetical protein